MKTIVAGVEFKIDYEVDKYDGIILNEVDHKGADFLELLGDWALDRITDQIDQQIRTDRAWSTEKEDYLADAGYEDIALRRRIA